MTNQYKQLPKNGIFYCYSYPLMTYLILNDFDVINTGVNPSTNKTFYCFAKGEELDEALKQFAENKKKYFESRESR